MAVRRRFPAGAFATAVVGGLWQLSATKPSGADLAAIELAGDALKRGRARAADVLDDRHDVGGMLIGGLAHGSDGSGVTLAGAPEGGRTIGVAKPADRVP